MTIVNLIYMPINYSLQSANFPEDNFQSANFLDFEEETERDNIESLTLSRKNLKSIVWEKLMRYMSVIALIRAIRKLTKQWTSMLPLFES